MIPHHPIRTAGATTSLAVALLLGGCATSRPAILTASAAGDPREVERLLDGGADVNARDASGLTPLFLAAQNGSKPVVELLIARGAAVDVAARLGSGETLLHAAAVGGLAELAGQLIAKGAAVDARGGGETTPLYLAAKRNKVEAATLLIAHGADVNAASRSRFTPLYIAAEEGNPAVARVLLDHGADVRARDKDGVTPLLRSMQALNYVYLLSSQSPAAIDLRRRASLVGPRLKQEWAAVHAAGGQWREVALLLIDRGAEIDLVIPGSADTATPLAVASVVGDRGVAAALIGKGANLNGAKGANETPLHAAIAESHEEVAQLLVGAGADVNARNVSRRTPLHFVARYVRSGGALAELLIAKGAEVGAKDAEGRTPMDFAKAAKNDAVAEVLRRHGG